MGDDISFEEKIPIPRRCFRYVCTLVEADLQQQSIPRQILEAVPSRGLPVQKKVAIALYLHGVAGPLHSVASLFGVGRSTVTKVFREFVHAILKHKSTFIRWPQSQEEWRALKAGFARKQGFPNCCGVIDVTHSNMQLSSGEAHTHWYDRNKNYSMSLQAVVDSVMRFLDVMCGMPGMCNDIRVLRNSSLFRKAQSNTIFNGPTVVNGRHRIREYILADGGYLNLPWMVIPFPAVENDAEKHQFNFRLSSTRIVVERTFGRLKQMWAYLHQRVRNPDPEFLPKVVATCCILHNIWLDFGIVYPKEEGPEVAEPPTPHVHAVTGMHAQH
ncbi:hypothetical protein L7F22_047945 [Adiantum nelumboides]|nr:hypothetical protein [Adiantum nelumboides]